MPDKNTSLCIWPHIFSAITIFISEYLTHVSLANTDFRRVNNNIKLTRTTCLNHCLTDRVEAPIWAYRQAYTYTCLLPLSLCWSIGLLLCWTLQEDPTLLPLSEEIRGWGRPEQMILSVRGDLHSSYVSHLGVTHSNDRRMVYSLFFCSIQVKPTSSKTPDMLQNQCASAHTVFIFLKYTYLDFLALWGRASYNRTLFCRQ